MGLLPQDRRGQLLLVFAFVAGVAGYVFWQGLEIPGLKTMGFSTYRAEADTMQRTLDSLSAALDTVEQDILRGRQTQLAQRMVQFRATRDLMAQLVPTSSDLPALLDRIYTAAKIRGLQIGDWSPQAQEAWIPFDRKRVRMQVLGRYDQIAEFLTDIASLPRIVVPYDLSVGPIAGPQADSAQYRGKLQASFKLLTYVRPAPGAPPPVAPSSPGGAPAPASPPARNPAAPGGDHE
jgi:Tfp pilus assembly protein PilO